MKWLHKAYYPDKVQMFRKIYKFSRRCHGNKYKVQRVKVAVEGGSSVIQLEGHDLSVDDMMGGIAV